MAKKAKQVIDYNKLSLCDVIRRTIGKDANFFELDNYEKRDVLDYIHSHSIDIKVLGFRWYDLLSNKFFVNEYCACEDSVLGVIKETREFDSFRDFYAFLKGDIQERSCYCGYHFSKEEIDEFAIDVGSLNFESLITDTIDDYTFDSINAMNQESISAIADRAKAIVRWFERSKPISTLKDLERKYKQFTQKYDFWDAKFVFFSMLLRRDKDLVRQAVLDYFCKHDVCDGISFQQILLTYGRDAALYVIDNFDGFCSIRTRKKRVKGFKRILSVYDGGNLSLERVAGFDDSLQLYYARDRYYVDGLYFFKITEYFGDLGKLATYAGGDLSNADFSKAPLSKNELLEYKINENTKLPSPMQYDAYQVTKQFAKSGFVVIQRWIDSNGATVLSKEHFFTRFFDFAHFLKGDLSDADLLLCDGVENIRTMEGLKLDGVKIRSEAAKKLGLVLNLLPSARFVAKGFESTEKNELATIGTFVAEHPDDDDYSGKVSYIADIHLLHRISAFKCETLDDANYVIKTIAKTLGDQATGVNLIAGDTSSDFEVFKAFIDNLTSYREKGDFFFTLGNHELWGMDGESLPSIVDKYRTALEEKGCGWMHLLQNNIFYADGGWKEIPENELSSISSDDLRARMRSARLIIFGGIGFAGMNDVFNADCGIYRSTISRKEELKESSKFLVLYKKIVSALKGKNLIVLTHMPMKDWGGTDLHAEDGFVYINGHNHRNFFYDDGKKRIYADNQVGYKGKRLSFKQLAIDFDYDWFSDYADGIYEITKEDYEKFYRGIGEALSFSREHEKLFMVKRDETYMFLMQTAKGSMLVLNGGAIKKAGNHTLEYFYDNLAKYATSVRLYLKNYDAFQKQVSKEIKRIGGDGRIHGSIVDIDFYSHLYLNPLDGTITPYFAYSMVDKYVYENLPSLLKSECPELFANYQELIDHQSGENALAICGKKLPISRKKIYVDSTEMYRISRILKGLQFTTKYNIVRLWNDAIVADASAENGKLIVSEIIGPNSIF